MILLDTNVVSDGLKKKPNIRVREWLDSLEPTSLWISSVTVAELQIGVELMDDGKRKSDVRAGIDKALESFVRRCVAFDARAAYKYAGIIAMRKRMGRPIEAHDAQIAAIALSAAFTLATMNTKDFAGVEGLTIVDPSL